MFAMTFTYNTPSGKVQHLDAMGETYKDVSKILERLKKEGNKNISLIVD